MFQNPRIHNIYGIKWLLHQIMQFVFFFPFFWAYISAIFPRLFCRQTWPQTKFQVMEYEQIVMASLTNLIHENLLQEVLHILSLSASLMQRSTVTLETKMLQIIQSLCEKSLCISIRSWEKVHFQRPLHEQERNQWDFEVCLLKDLLFSY